MKIWRVNGEDDCFLTLQNHTDAENTGPMSRHMRWLSLFGNALGRHFEFFPLWVPFYFLNLFLFLKFCFPFTSSSFFLGIFAFFYLWFQIRPRWISFTIKHSYEYSLVSRNPAEPISLYINFWLPCSPHLRYLTVPLKTTCISACSKNKNGFQPTDCMLSVQSPRCIVLM